MTVTNSKIRIFALGGLDESGKNCIVIEIDGDIYVIGPGIAEPDKTMPGVDYLIPNYDYLKENKDRVKGYFLLHGHDDEIGALAYMYEDVPAPVFGSAVTLAMLKIFTSHVKKDPSMYKTVTVDPTSTFLVGGRKVHFFHTAHNIADSSGMAIETPYGNIVYGSDYVVENAADKDYLFDITAISQIAEKPTLALLAESLYATRPGYTAPKYKLTDHVLEAFKNAEGRIFVSLFSSNLYNFDEIIRLSVLFKRKIVCYDSGASDILKAMQPCGSLVIPRENFASTDDILRHKDQDLVILMSGFGAKLFRKIAMLASGENEDKRIKIKPTDTFVIASPSDDNTELEFVDAADELFRTGCKVVMVPKKSFMKMQASEEDLKMMASLFKPKYYIPVKGFYKDLLANAMLALSMGLGLTHQNVFVLENGMSVLIDEKGARVFDEKIPHGDLMIDGSGVGDISTSVLSDRTKLAEGAVIVAATISRKKMGIVAGPEVQTRGLVVGKEADALTRDLSKILLSTVEELVTSYDFNMAELKQNVYEKSLRAIRRSTGKEPMVLPLLVEVE